MSQTLIVKKKKAKTAFTHLRTNLDAMEKSLCHDLNYFSLKWLKRMRTGSFLCDHFSMIITGDDFSRNDFCTMFLGPPCFSEKLLVF